MRSETSEAFEDSAPAVPVPCRDQTPFDLWWQRSGERYEAAVLAAGDLPWALDPEKRIAVAERLGLPHDTDPMELRRALWQRGRTTRGNAS